MRKSEYTGANHYKSTTSGRAQSGEGLRARSGCSAAPSGVNRANAAHIFSAPATTAPRRGETFTRERRTRVHKKYGQNNIYSMMYSTHLHSAVFVRDEGRYAEAKKLAAT